MPAGAPKDDGAPSALGTVALLGAIVVGFALMPRLFGHSEGPLAGKDAPEVALKLVANAPSAGDQVSLSSLHGHPVLLDFWATWCGPCRLAMPRLSAMQARYGAQGLRVVGLTADPAERVADFTAKAGLKYPVEVDSHGSTSVAYGVSVLPTLYVIDKRGVVRDVATGFDPGRDAQIEALVKQLLSEPSP
jgi:peroxiredoxin